jgi:hypothetical protein
MQCHPVSRNMGGRMPQGKPESEQFQALLRKPWRRMDVMAG